MWCRTDAAIDADEARDALTKPYICESPRFPLPVRKMVGGSCFGKGVRTVTKHTQVEMAAQTLIRGMGVDGPRPQHGCRIRQAIGRYHSYQQRDRGVVPRRQSISLDRI